MQKNKWNIKGQTTPVRIPNDYIDFVIKAIFREKKRREKKAQRSCGLTAAGMTRLGLNSRNFKITTNEYK